MAIKHYTELSAAAQAAYAQLLDAVLATEHMRTVADLPGSFAAKTVKGSQYWYFQYTEKQGQACIVALSKTENQGQACIVAFILGHR